MAEKHLITPEEAKTQYFQLYPLKSKEEEWDRFRMLASAIAMAGFIAREEQPLYPEVKETNCSRAIEWADELIRQLKEEK